MKAVMLMVLLLCIAYVHCTPSAIVTFTPTASGPQGATGTVVITASNGKPGIDLHVQISGLTASTVHGFHIHQYGDITDGIGTGMGGHYNPNNYPHGCFPTTNRHLGDMGNITADINGMIDTVVYNELAGLDLNDPISYIVGRGVVLHATFDDCVTANTGNAGGRIMFGVIGYQFGSTSNPTTTDYLPSSNYQAVAKMVPTTGNTLGGNVTLTFAANGVVTVWLYITGLVAGSTHGIHIHQFGDLSWNNGTAAGGHFNPYSQPHGCPINASRHVGDMGNFVADSNGDIFQSYTNTLASLAVNHNASIIGRAVVVHANMDDCSTPNTGNAGARLAHGIIGFRAAPVVATTTAPTNAPTTAAPTNAPTTIPNNATSDANGLRVFGWTLVLTVVAVLLALLA